MNNSEFTSKEGLTSKTEIRKSIIKNLSQEKYWLYDDIVIEKILNFTYQNPQVKNIGLYYPLPGEVNLLNLLNRFEGNFALPSTQAEEMEYVLINKYTKLSFSKKSFLPLVQESNIIIPDLICVPGIAFDLNKFRLGRGKGFFDRYIKKQNLRKNFTENNINLKEGLINNLQINQYPIFLGICYEIQLVEILPIEAHDQKVDFIITEKNIIL
jgi:5-formyltetrahydrofolate cyclo-ligase